MVDRDWLYELGRLIPDELMDELEAMENASDVVKAVQSLPVGLMEKPKPVKKAAPKKKTTKKAAKKDE